MPFRSITPQDANLFACIFRQHRATDEQQKLMAHTLGFTFTFEATELDDCKRVLDVELLELLYTELDTWFGGKLIVAIDDPKHDILEPLHAEGVVRMVRMDHVGHEAFARHAFNLAQDFLRITGLAWRLRCVEVTCFERGYTHATFIPANTTN